MFGMACALEEQRCRPARSDNRGVHIMNERDSRRQFSSALARLQRRHLVRYVRRIYQQHPNTLRRQVSAGASHGQVDYPQRRDEALEGFHNRLEGPVIYNVWIPDSRPLSDEQVRFHAQLSDRLVAMDRERYGLWSRIRRFLLGKHLDP